MKAWQDAKDKRKTDGKKGKKSGKGKGEKPDESKACTNPENLVLGHCVRRQLIISCPSWDETEKCGSLMTFAKGCPYYPILEGDKAGRKDTRKEVQREKKIKKTVEKKVKKEGDSEGDE